MDTKLKPLSPTQAIKELEALDKLFNNGEFAYYTPSWYGKQKARIYECSKLWARKARDGDL